MPDAGVIPLEVLAGPYEQVESSTQKRVPYESSHADEDAMTGGNFNTFGE